MDENRTFRAILARMLSRVSADLDKREGSVIYDALAPAAMEMAELYAAMEVNLRLAFAGTSSGRYLELRAAELGLARRMASPAQRRGLFRDAAGQPFEVAIGSRFGMESLHYTVHERLAAGEYRLECETAGATGNRSFGKLVPVEYVPGLADAQLTDVLVPGEETESDEALRARYALKAAEPATSGNVHHYRQWASEVPGVGGAQVFSLWDGPGTVKVVVVDSDKRPATVQLVQDVAEHVEKMRPIGAEVTVVSAVGVAIDVQATIVLAAGYTLQAAQDELERQLTDYLRDTALESTYVSYARIGTLLLATPGVLDYSELKLNGGTTNVILQNDQVPVVGTVSLGV